MEENIHDQIADQRIPLLKHQFLQPQEHKVNIQAYPNMVHGDQGLFYEFELSHQFSPAPQMNKLYTALFEVRS